jgi:hypothetical protein
MQLLLAATPVRPIMSFVIPIYLSLGIVNVAARMEQQMTLPAMQNILIAKITGIGPKHSAATALWTKMNAITEKQAPIQQTNCTSTLTHVNATQQELDAL